ncbi:hypothetical protein D9Q98_000389 [Chlorella vulgaris]|uniref:Uncharacterized protein n=1 Tax=Chlorella vulgaris TaxID=3077 RepID=A0A9D4TY18_CHLVU|nr:hypothetical protein D9Q98_000389 [Chlorella vulgaris]
MKAPRGSGLPTHHSKLQHGGARGLLGRFCWASVGPFLAALLLGSVLFRAGGGSGSDEFVAQRGNHRSVLEDSRFPTGCLGSNCGHGSLAGGGVGAQSHVQSSPLESGSSGAGSPQGELPQLFLFIGILSGRGYRHRRLAVREAWSNRAQVPGQVVARFILSEDERTPQVEKELEQYGDIVFVQQKTNYKSILYKTYHVMEYAAANYDPAFVLKTDDDAFINVAPLMEQLRAMCENPDCRRERLYMGKMAKHSEVLLQPGHKWNNAAFHNHTGLKEYPNYMMGGGYVVGGEVARILVDINTRMRLKFTPIEDATLGFWLMAMDLRHIDHPRFYTWAAPCCFKAPVRKPGERFVTRFQLSEAFDADLCSSDPWVVLHKIDSPTKMRYVGAHVANCTPPAQPWALAPSIAAHVSEERRQFFTQQWQQEHPGEVLVLAGNPPTDASGGAASSDGGSGSNLAYDGTVAASGGDLTSASAGIAAGGEVSSAGSAGSSTTAAAAAALESAGVGPDTTAGTADGLRSAGAGGGGAAGIAADIAAGVAADLGSSSQAAADAGGLVSATAATGGVGPADSTAAAGSLSADGGIDSSNPGMGDAASSGSLASTGAAQASGVSSNDGAAFSNGVAADSSSASGVAETGALLQ